ncbi:helix-turn-helix domain-containing protein [Streptacidiphilus sp. MAP5-3]|uniref:helix-turn-helix domain-containing protein n=1 Tax=unclassified Streptacidiphilus TaxID=2643834 RepID=UPI0035152FD0
MADQPTGLPDRLLSDPDFIDACAGRDIGTVFRMARGRAGFYPSRIARQTGLTVSRATEVMDGKRSPNSIVVLERIADGLGIPGHLLGLAPRPWEPEEAVAPLPTGPETWEVLDTLTRSTASDSTLLHLEAAVLRGAALYPSTPPAQLMPDMARQLAKVHELLDRPQSLSGRRRCVEALAILGGLFGLAHTDLGDIPRSAAMFHMAQVAAGEAENRPLSAWLLTMQGISLIATRQATRGAELLDHADQLAADASHRRRAWIAANQARAHSEIDQRGPALDALNRARHQLDLAGPVGGLDFFTPARLDGIHGTAMLNLGDAQAAESLLEAALANRDRSDAKGRAMLTFDLAECRILQGEIDAACLLAQNALNLAGPAAVEPAVIRAKAVHRAMEPWKETRPVRALAERVRESRVAVRD